MTLIATAAVFSMMLPALLMTASGQTGSVTGSVPLPKRPANRIAVEKYTGSISGKVFTPPVVKAGVWLEGANASARNGRATGVLAQHGYQFTESLLVVPVGATVEFPNQDADYHNIRSFSRAKRFELQRYKKDENPQPSVTFDKPGFVRLSCEIHDHMSAAVLVVDSRWHTLTDAAGKFSLTGIPPGSYTLHAQLDEKTRWSSAISVRAGKTTAASLVPVPALP